MHAEEICEENSQRLSHAKLEEEHGSSMRALAIEAEQMCGEARGEAATWRDLSRDAGEKAEELQSRLWDYEVSWSEQEQQVALHEKKAAALESQRSGVELQVKEAHAAMAAVRRELAGHREREWQGGMALQALDETQQELNDLQASSKTALEEVAMMPRLRSELAAAQTGLREARETSCRRDHAASVLPEVQLELAKFRAQCIEVTSELAKTRYSEQRAKAENSDAGEALVQAHSELSNLLQQRRLSTETLLKSEHAEMLVRRQARESDRATQEIKGLHEEVKELKAEMLLQKSLLGDSEVRERDQAFPEERWMREQLQLSESKAMEAQQAAQKIADALDSCPLLDVDIPRAQQAPENIADVPQNSSNTFLSLLADAEYAECESLDVPAAEVNKTTGAEKHESFGMLSPVIASPGDISMPVTFNHSATVEPFTPAHSTMTLTALNAESSQGIHRVEEVRNISACKYHGDVMASSPGTDTELATPQIPRLSTGPEISPCTPGIEDGLASVLVAAPDPAAQAARIGSPGIIPKADTLVHSLSGVASLSSSIEFARDSEVDTVIAEAANEAQQVLKDLAAARARLTSQSRALISGPSLSQFSSLEAPSGVQSSSWHLPWPPPPSMSLEQSKPSSTLVASIGRSLQYLENPDIS
jgi:hypothetical protein